MFNSLSPAPAFNAREHVLANLSKPMLKRTSAHDTRVAIQRHNLWFVIHSEVENILAKKRDAWTS